MKKATINLTGLGCIYVPGKIQKAFAIVCGALTKDGTPVNSTVHTASVAQIHYAKADETEAAGYYLREVSPHIFMLVSPDA